MSSHKLKRPLYFPKCLNCSTVLLLRDFLGRKKVVVQCGKCGVRYNRTFIKDADPKTWERVRKRRLFTLYNDMTLFLNDGVGSRKRAE